MCDGNDDYYYLKLKPLYYFLIHPDVNECTAGIHQCAQNCHNNVGSYSCSCTSGYRLNADGRRCDGKYFTE